MLNYKGEKNQYTKDPTLKIVVNIFFYNDLKYVIKEKSIKMKRNSVKGRFIHTNTSLRLYKEYFLSSLSLHYRLSPVCFGI